ncbi:hybrid sensor histidine kinase/response regulator [Maribellus maritimus]|uniref:hybrid sensor histidine kinase/response regulator n=1 Tax=Maribellus maritimus TaxID=2870838 RepID=UPI001EEB5C01|nr:ATP-binding protein [Maribellus maritimus]MCG6189435.1 response regulator [Maribellus maritimus]
MKQDDFPPNESSFHLHEEFLPLNEDEDLYKQMFQFSLLPIIIHDMDMNILDANIMAVEEFGYPKEELLEMKVFDLHIESELEHSSKVLEEMKHKNKLSVETSFVRKDKSVFIAEATPCKYILNNKPLIHVYIQNITQRKNDEIKLVKAMEKAEESDRLKSAFLANMSHELRTPLNAILGYSSFLKDKNKTDDDIERYADVIRKSGEHLMALINDIIDISLIEAGKVKVAQNHFELNSLLIALYNFFHSYLISKKKFNLLLKLDIPESDFLIVSDETRLRQILTNLLSNAIKFCEKGIIEFGYRIETKNIIFFVKDTGIGIPVDKKEIVFGRFVKVAESREKLYEGTGLGLSIAKACTEMLNGKIWFDSVENIGTTFYFTIEYKAGTQSKEQLISSNITPYEFNNELVLIAEDDEYNYSFLEESLKEYNLRLIRAVTGQEAINKVMEHDDISLILMDIKMPVLSGIDATIEVKKQKPEIPIIAQTAFAYESDKREILNAGCIECLTKPIDKKLLLELIYKNIVVE